MQEAGDNARPKSQRHLSSGPLSSMEMLSSLRLLWALQRSCLKGLFLLSIYSSFLLSEVSIESVSGGWALLNLNDITSSLNTSNLTSSISKHYETDQLGSWIWMSWYTAHSVVLAKRHCLRCEGLFSLLTMFSQQCLVAENLFSPCAVD